MIGDREKAQVTGGIEHQERHPERSDHGTEFYFFKNKLTMYLVKVDVVQAFLLSLLATQLQNLYSLTLEKY